MTKIYNYLNNKIWKSNNRTIWNSSISSGLIVCLSAILFLFPMTLSTAYASSNDKQDKNSMVSGQELEKPKPVFTRNGSEISAKLIPRAKSTSVTLNFKVTKGGKLLDVKGMDFEKAARPEVDIKNYKSALFVVEIGDVSPAGSDATVNISSDFFASGTEYRVFNEKLPQPWFNSECHNVASKGRVRELMITVKDGGPFDSDGQANGSITFVGGPRDSFWGYALGTLFIRFFGIFLVLGVLMIGMMLSGMFFSRADSKNGAKESDDDLNSTSSDVVDSVSSDPEIIAEENVVEAQHDSEEIAPNADAEAKFFDEAVDDYEIAAAIATALHLHFQTSAPAPIVIEKTEPTATFQRVVCPVQQTNTWSNDGRSQIMRERQQTYNRTNR
ncbi:MAG: hypothetical protein HQK72_14510 [Desulfamplus sp.]|nr:hypothetical protein [Desulfamplus sp.]